MKITSKTLMVSFEHDLKFGPNDSIELKLLSHAYISKDEKDNPYIDLDLGIDFTNIKFLGQDVNSSYDAVKEFKKSLLQLGINFDELVSEKEKEIIDSGIEDKLKLMFKDKI